MTPPEIKVLPEDVANRIAAGEVVERPAAAVKELLENSVDAGATRIDIEFKNGGKSFVKISDNGCGMSRGQLLMSLKPHATSKIGSPEDLFSITSYGFRGEAVPSIASVSKFTMSSRPESQNSGTRVEVFAGDVKSVGECGMPVGTETVVENLFCSVPARRKFLKSDNVEASHITKLCRLYALALPNLSLTLVENSRVLFRSERGLSLIERIGRIYGRDISDKLIELEESTRDGMTLRGAVLKAGESFATNRNICAFINSRPVESRAVYSALKEAYAHFLPKGRYAAAFLFIELDPATVDVNVHPAKREVRLKNEFAVRDFLCERISLALSKFSIAYKREFFSDSAQPCSSGKTDSAARAADSEESECADAKVRPKRQTPQTPPSPLPPPAKFSAPKPAFTPADFPSAGAMRRLPPNFARVKNVDAEQSVPPPESDAAASPCASPDTPSPCALQSASKEICAAGNIGFGSAAEAKKTLPDWRYIGALKKRFAVFESEKGLVLMSLCSALRRVKYAKILDGLRGAKKSSQMLLMPISIKFERGDAEYFEANADAFAACGFEIEEFGKNFYRITAVPEWMSVSDAENFVRDFVALAHDEERGMKRKRAADEMFARLAVARTGIGGFECSQSSASGLLAKLLECPSHMSSPDGKPTLKEISDAEISRMFGL